MTSTDYEKRESKILSEKSAQTKLKSIQFDYSSYMNCKSVTFTLTDNGRQTPIFLYIFRRLPQRIYINMIYAVCVYLFSLFLSLSSSLSLSVHVIQAIYAIFQSCSFVRLSVVCMLSFSLGLNSTFQRLYKIQRILYVIVATSCSTCCSHIYFYCFLPLSRNVLYKSYIRRFSSFESNIHICDTYVWCVSYSLKIYTHEYIF